MSQSQRDKSCLYHEFRWRRTVGYAAGCNGANSIWCHHYVRLFRWPRCFRWAPQNEYGRFTDDLLLIFVGAGAEVCGSVGSYDADCHLILD